MYTTRMSQHNRIVRFGQRIQLGNIPQASHEFQKEKVNEPESYLDLFSTSAEFQPAPYQKRTCAPPEFCINGAPFFAYCKHDKTYAVVQGCCNSWNCPRCGLQRAKQEYGRIIEGVRNLAQPGNETDLHTPIYFITITCKGREISVKDAECNYLKWTHKFMDSCRDKAKRSNLQWAYVAVTERQKRGHPHSHILTTWAPPNQYQRTVDKWAKDAQGVLRKNGIQEVGSKFVERSLCSSGLGSQYNVSIARTIEGTSRYVAKYLFKDNIFQTVWPPGWKRVRYSNNFPKLERTKSEAFVLLRREDWQKLTHVALAVAVNDDVCKSEVEFWLRGSDTIIIDKQKSTIGNLVDQFT